MSRVIEKHYRTFAKSSRSSWIHRESYGRFWARFLTREISLSPNDRILDLGGGKGDLSKALIKEVHPKHQIVCIDPNHLMLSRIKNPDILDQVGEAIGFLSSCEDASFDAIIMKQVIHHIQSDQRKELYAQLHRVLSPGGRVSVLTMPPTILYPMFRAAVRNFEKGQICHEELAGGLRGAGFSLRTVPGDYPVRISWDNYRQAVRERFISDLRSFTSEQIEKGLLDTRRRLGKVKTMNFHDRLVAFIGTKNQ